jgi:hypothetical protein
MAATSLLIKRQERAAEAIALRLAVVADALKIELPPAPQYQRLTATPNARTYNDALRAEWFAEVLAGVQEAVTAKKKATRST